MTIKTIYDYLAIFDHIGKTQIIISLYNKSRNNAFNKCKFKNISITVNSFSKYIIDTKAIRKNLLAYKAIDHKSKICAVIKANGYGIGADNVVCAIDDMVDFYAVACFNEAKKLRERTQKPILILNFVNQRNLEYCSLNNISITIGNLTQLKCIIKQKQKINIHIAINSGMNRIGFKSKNDFLKAMQLLKTKEKYICLEGIFTHFYNGENPCATKIQFEIFMQFINILKLYFNDKKIIKHICSSVPAIKFNEYRFDMVRLGILLFGAYQKIKNIMQFPVLKIESKIIEISHIKKGECVGYANGFVSKKNMLIGTVPLGYADGILRKYAQKGFVLCGGKKCKIVGNICMDMFMIDLTKTSAKIGDKIVLIGNDKNSKITLENVAKKCNTIAYEILTNLKPNRMNVVIK